MKILITGGAGFIGSHIADQLLSNENKIIVIDNLSTGKIENISKKIKFYCEDINNHERIEQIFQDESPEIVYHLAADINLRKSLEKPIENAETNILGTLNLIELSRKNNVSHFIFSSTGGAIYSAPEEIPTRENYKKFPISPYGCSKLAIERYLYSYNQTYGLKFSCLRYSNVYGPRQSPENESGVVSIFFTKMLKGISPEIYGGTQTRDFIFVDDVVNANILALSDKKSKMYNISTGKETDIIEIFTKINRYFSNKFEPLYFPIKKGEEKRSCLSYKKIKDSLGWVPKTSLDEGLDKTYAWFIKNQKL